MSSENAYVTWCPDHEKRVFATGAAARKTAKQIPGRRMNAYRCNAGRGWHLGHLPLGVVRGLVSKDEYTRALAKPRKRDEL